MSIGGDGYGERDRTGRRDPAHDQDRLTTRTRLPEGEGDTRPSPRPGKSLVTVVGVVVLLIAAIAFVNRSGGETENTADGKDAGGGPAAQPTAPSGEKPVKQVHGQLPSGFAHSKEGAQSAAANYSIALGGDEMYSAPARKKIVDGVYTPEAAKKRLPSLDNVYSDTKFLKGIGLKDDGTAPKGQTFISRVNPVGAKVNKYSASEATVSLWYSSLFGMAGEGSKNPVTESWYTNTYELKWMDGDWKVEDFKQKEGPAPISKDQKSAPADEMADAVHGFGGFTYAR